MIGLILGDTDFPKKIVKKLNKIKKKYLIIDLSSKNIFKKNSYNFYQYEHCVQRELDYLKKYFYL